MSKHHRKKKRVFIPPGVRVRKSSGLIERFSPVKLRTSLIRCGTPTRDAREITDSIRQLNRAQWTTDAIREYVSRRLRDAHPTAATRYELSRSVIKLGPTGFPFEKLIGQLYEAEGYDVKINQTYPGICVDHEIDVVAEKDGKRVFVECKFHHTSWSVCDLKTALYVKARSDDLNRSLDARSRHDHFVLLTNTRFSSEALAFGQCSGLELVGWTHPPVHSLSQRLETSGLIPLTALTSIPRRLVEHLMLEGIVTVRDLVEKPFAWRMLGKNPDLLENIQNEIDRLFETVS